MIRPVHEHPQSAVEIRTALYFVEDDQPAQSFQGQHGIRESGEALVIFEIEEGDGFSSSLCDQPRQSGFACLPGAEDSYHGMPLEQAVHNRYFLGSRIHT